MTTSNHYPDSTITNAKIDAVDDYIDTEVAAIKAKTDNLPTSTVWQRQADAYLSQANPVSTTLYEVLATTANVKIISIATNITWATTQPNPLVIIATVDGVSVEFTQADPVSATTYLPNANVGGAATSHGFATSHAISTEIASLLCSGRSVKIAVRVTWATTQPTPLVCRVKYAQKS